MLWINEGHRPRSGLGVVIAQLRVNLPILASPRRIDNPDVLHDTAVEYPPDGEFTGAVSYVAVRRKVGVFDIPGSDKAAKCLGLIAQRGMRAHSLEFGNHIEARICRWGSTGFSRCGCVPANTHPRQNT